MTPQAPPKKTPGPSTNGAPLRGVKPAPVPAKLTPHEHRRDGLTGWLQLGSSLLYQASPFRNDALVIAHFGPPFAEEAANLADDDERVARLLDKIADMGPYAALVMIAVSAGMQIGANHGLVKPGVLGTMAPDDFAAAVLGEGDDDSSPDVSPAA